MTSAPGNKIGSGRKDIPLKAKVDRGGSEVFLKAARQLVRVHKASERIGSHWERTHLE